MSEEHKVPLPIPIGDALEDTRGGARSAARQVHEDELWVRITARRRGSSPERSTALPLPLSTALARTGEDARVRAKHWRAVNARRGLARDATARTRWLATFAVGSGLSAVAALLVVLLWRGPLVVLVDAKPARAPQTQALTLASGAPLDLVDAKQSDVELVLTDASTIRLARGARLVPLASTDSRLDVLLERGSAVFSVTPGGPRRWTIAAGLVRVEVVGTEFRVERTLDQVAVAVSHGIVLVSGPTVPNGVQRLTAGQQLRVAPAQASLEPTPVPTVSPLSASTPLASPPSSDTALTENAPVPSEPAAEPPASTGNRGKSNAKRRPPVAPPPPSPEPETPPLAPTPIRTSRGDEPTWREELRLGRYDAAYQALAGERFVRTAQLARTAQELLDLADVARLSGHPRDALVPLNRVLDEFARSPHAAVAAFTLGRALLDQLYQPRDAAKAFERAISMQPPRALLEDCYARLVQAYARMGAQNEAARAAAKYRERFPNGRHTAELARWLAD